MCGITGYISATQPLNGAWLTAATESIIHRGPDDFAYAIPSPDQSSRFSVLRELDPDSGASVGLGHRRLSILDLSPRGRQPMLSPDGRRALTFNGEIYNYQELRRDLEADGEIFVTETDTEVLLRLLLREGKACLPKLRGMFGFCYVDLKARYFLLARDPFGIKPLYFSQHEGKLAFGSEMRCLREIPWLTTTTAPQKLFDFLRFGVADESRTTMTEGIRQVPPASFLEGTFEVAHLAAPQVYWAPQPASNQKIAFDEAKEEIRRRFIASVRIHLRADVPIGAALSGGVDSSAIVCAMRHLEPDLDLHTFTYSPTGFIYDELPWANLVAQHTKAHQHITNFTTDELVADLDQVLKLQEEPFGSTSIYAQYCIFKKVSESPVKVMLDGQGGDETLAGYPTYIGAHIADSLKRGKWSTAARIANYKRDSMILKTAAMHFVPDALQDTLRKVVGKEFYPSYLNKKWFTDRDVVAKRLERPLGKLGLNGMLWDNLNSSLLPQLLHFEDRNSMAFSIESRVPFLETDFVEFALSLPAAHLISDSGITKHVFKEAMRGLVPDAILDRRDKIGFHTPGREILIKAEAWVKAAINGKLAQSQAWLDTHALLSTYQDIKSGKLTNQHEQGFWRVICYLSWLNLR